MPDPLNITAVQSNPVQRVYTPSAEVVVPDDQAAVIEQVMTMQRAAVAQPQVQMQASPQANVALRFVVDPDSQKLTVYMVDKSSKEIIRTIPPDEIRNLKAGDLVTLFA